MARGIGSGALLFLHRDVLGRALGNVANVVRAKQPARLPLILTRHEVEQILTHMLGTPRLMASLLYGAGLRLMECCRLRVGDLDFERHEIRVRDGKGHKDRLTLLPAKLEAPLRSHLGEVLRQHELDLGEGRGGVELPRSSEPRPAGAAWDWRWQWVFPAAREREDRTTGKWRRSHIAAGALQREFAIAVRAARVAKPASCHTLRHSFAVHLFEAGHSVARSRNSSATATSPRP